MPHPSGVRRIEGERSLMILTGLIEFLSPGILEKSRERTEDSREIYERIIIMEGLKMSTLVKVELPGANMMTALEELDLGSTTSIHNHLYSDKCRVYRSRRTQSRMMSRS